MFAKLLATIVKAMCGVAAQGRQQNLVYAASGYGAAGDFLDYSIGFRCQGLDHPPQGLQIGGVYQDVDCHRARLQGLHNMMLLAPSM